MLMVALVFLFRTHSFASSAHTLTPTISTAASFDPGQKRIFQNLSRELDLKQVFYANVTGLIKLPLSTYRIRIVLRYISGSGHLDQQLFLFQFTCMNHKRCLSGDSQAESNTHRKVILRFLYPYGLGFMAFVGRNQHSNKKKSI